MSNKNESQDKVVPGGVPPKGVSIPSKAFFEGLAGSDVNKALLRPYEAQAEFYGIAEESE